MSDNGPNRMHAYVLAKTDGICAYCGARVDSEEAHVTTSGGPWVAYCNEAHYQADRGVPVLTIGLNDAE